MLLARERSRTPTTMTGGLPNCAPIAAALGPESIGTFLAPANRTTLSTARGLASSATTTHQHFPPCTPLRTASPPTTIRPPRYPNPTRPNRPLMFAAGTPHHSPHQ